MVPDLLVRSLSQATIARLKARARAAKRSLQAELKFIIERAAHEHSQEELKQIAATLRAQLSDRTHSDSALLVREDRER